MAVAVRDFFVLYDLKDLTEAKDKLFANSNELFLVCVLYDSWCGDARC